MPAKKAPGGNYGPTPAHPDRAVKNYRGPVPEKQAAAAKSRTYGPTPGHPDRAPKNYRGPVPSVQNAAAKKKKK